MRVLITGGAGFIGSHVADRLLARGDRVLVVDNFATGRRDNLPPREALELVEASIADTARVDAIFERFRPELVVHAAASYKDPENWAEDARTNVVGTANVTRAAARAGAERLIYFQTALCYGLRPRESPITLDHPLLPADSSYAVSKTAGEHYVALSGLDFLSFRLANAYGPRNLSGPLPTFFHRLSSGRRCFVMDSRRDFVFIDDLVDVVMRAVDGRGSRGYYHVASGGDVSIRELFDSAVRALGVRLDEPVEVRPRSADDAPSILLDPSRTAADFDWKATTALDEGVTKAIAYYRAFGVEQTFTHLKGVTDE